MKLTDEGTGSYSSFPASNGWSMPTKGSLSAFRTNLGIDEKNYSSDYGLSEYYWSSSYYTKTYQNHISGTYTITRRYYVSVKSGKIFETVNGNFATRWMIVF